MVGAKTNDVVEEQACEAEVPQEETVEEVEASVIEEEEAENSDASSEPQDAAEAEEPSAEEMLANAQAEAKEWQDKYLRLHAEWDTYRRRMNMEREEERARACEKLVENIIPVIDDFERTIDYAEKNGETGLLGGVKAVHTKLNDVLAKQGVVVINPKGEALDPLEAQAVATVDDTSVPDETVAEVYQLGYRMGNKVIRPAMVTVAVGGPARETVAESEAE